MAPYNAAIPGDVVADVANREKEIVAGKLKVFAGPLKDRDGKQRVAAGAVLPDNEVRSISWPWSEQTASIVDAFGAPQPTELREGQLVLALTVTPLFVTASRRAARSGPRDSGRCRRSR